MGIENNLVKENHGGPMNAVFICVFNRKLSKVLLIKRNYEKRKRWGFDWGIIGGKTEKGELLRESAIREAQEEIGVEFRPEQLRLMFFEEFEREEKNIIHFFFHATLEEKDKIKVNFESDEHKWFPVRKLPESMLDKERISRMLKILKGGGE